MFGKRIDLFTLFGFPVRIDLSWFFILVLVTWTLAVAYFPQVYGNFSANVYWAMGLLGALGLFFSIVVHEFSHAMVARRYGIPIKGITLFIFGGVSEMTEEPPDADSEIWMSVAGPASSLVMGAVFYGAGQLGAEVGWPIPVTAVLSYLGIVNVVLAVFNLFPAFPLDGGRVFRAALWKWKDNLGWATRVASRVGAGFGAVMVLLGLLAILSGALVGGIWWVLIGMFLRNSATMSYQQFQMKESLEGVPVRNFMQTNPITVPSQMTIQELVQEYFYRYYYKMFPVVENGHVTGCVNLDQVKKFTPQEWPRHTVAEAAVSCPAAAAVTPETSASKALAVMNETGQSKLMVMADDRLVGILTLKDLLSFMSMRMELESRAT